MTYGLACCVMTGRPWLGTFPTSQGKVLILDNELSPQELSHRTRKVAENMGINVEQYKDQLVIRTLKRKPESLSGLRTFFEQIEPYEYS